MPASSEGVEFYEILTKVYIAKPMSSLRKPLPLPRQVKKEKTNLNMNMKLQSSKPVKRNVQNRNLEATFNPMKKIKKVASKMSEKAKQFKKTKMTLNKMPLSKNVETLASTSAGKMASKSSKQKRHILLSANPPKEPKKIRRPTKKRNLTSGYRRRLLPLRKAQLQGLKQKQISGASKTLEISAGQMMKSEDSKVAIKSRIEKMADTKDVDASTEDKKDIETVLTIEKHPGDDNKLDIDLDTTVDPKTSKPIKVHTHAEVDKNKMELRGKAEAKEAMGKAKIEGQIFHQGSKDDKIIELEVVEDDYDSEDMSLEAKNDSKNKKGV